jgi:hypothetical protein
MKITAEKSSLPGVLASSRSKISEIARAGLQYRCKPHPMYALTELKKLVTPIQASKN